MFGDFYFARRGLVSCRRFFFSNGGDMARPTCTRLYVNVGVRTHCAWLYVLQVAGKQPVLETAGRWGHSKESCGERLEDL